MKSVLSTLILFLSLNVISQDRMTPELLWQLKRIGEVAVSPDNSQIAFTMREYNVTEGTSESNIYLVSALGGEPKQLTTSKGTEHNLIWSLDGKEIYYLAEGRGGSNIFSLTIADMLSKQLSQIKDGISGFKMSPDQKMVAFCKDVKLEKVTGAEIHTDMPKSDVRIIDDLMYRHWSDWEDGVRSHIFFTVFLNGKIEGQGVDIMEGELFDAPMKPFGGIEQFSIAPDNKSLVYVCKKLSGDAAALSTNSDVYSYNFESRQTTNLSTGNMGYDTDPAYSADGSKLAWLTMKKNGNEADKNDIVVYDVATKTYNNLTLSFDLTVTAFAWSEIMDKIFFKSVKEAVYQFYEYDFKSKNLRQITSGDNDFTSIAFAGDYLIGGRQNMNHPTDIYSVNIKSGEQKQLTDVNKAIYDKLQVGPIEKRWVTTTDGKKELVWVIFPPGFDKTKKYPALLYCQGGPQSAVSQFFSYRWNFQLMAANDYIIIAPNRRGLPGFGQEWNDAIQKDWGGQAMDDYLSAVDEIKKEPYVNADKIGAVGASYGGYSVYYLARIHDNRFKCFISHCGLFNLESWYGTTEEVFFANSDIGGPYYGDAISESYTKNSPHRMVEKWNTPMLIFHGEQDFRVPVNQGMEAFQACQLKGIDSKMILFPNENHFVLNPQNAIIWHREFYAWLDKYLK